VVPYAPVVSNLGDGPEASPDGIPVVRLADGAGSEYLGASLYHLQPGQEMVFHYHLQREELLIVLAGRVELRSAAGWEELAEGDVVAFPRGEHGAHGYRNGGDEPARVLMISEMEGLNISVYPDTDEIGIFDAARRSERRFGARFRVADAVSDYGGGKARITPPAPGPR
jgi:uncharacterized cupin superfamily protein